LYWILLSLNNIFRIICSARPLISLVSGGELTNTSKFEERKTKKDQLVGSLLFR